MKAACSKGGMPAVAKSEKTCVFTFYGIYMMYIYN